MRTGIKDKVAIVGMGCAKFGERWDVDADGLLAEACFEAFADAGIESSRIQAAWLGTAYSSIGGSLLSTTLKLRIPVSRVECACATAADALRNASFAVAAGVYDLVLVVGIEKRKDSGVSGVSGSERAGTHVGPNLTPPGFFALVANRYFRAYGIPDDVGKRALARIAVKNHHNGMLSPKAHFHREVTLDEVIKAAMIVPPLGLFDCCGVSDGAVAAIICPVEMAKKFRDDYVVIKGSGMCCGDDYARVPSDFDFLHWEENVAAAKLAYEEAGITNPREQIDMAIVHDCFTINELVAMEDLGFSPRGKAIEDIEAGFFELGGGLPVNTDGGLKCFGHPTGASGLRMMYEVYKQIQGRAGARQLKKKVNLGLTHSLGGFPGAFTSLITVLGRRD